MCVGRVDEYTRDAVGGRVIFETAHGDARAQFDIRRYREYALAQAMFQEPTTLAMQEHAVIAARREAELRCRGEVPTLERDRAVCRKCFQEPRHEASDRVFTTLQQHVHMMGLRRRASWLRQRGKFVAFQHEDVGEVRGGDPRGEHAADAAADNDGMPAQWR